MSVLRYSLNAHKLDVRQKRGNVFAETKPSSICLKQTSNRRGLSKYYVFCVGDKMIYHVTCKKRRFGAYIKIRVVLKLDDVTCYIYCIFTTLHHFDTNTS